MVMLFENKMKFQNPFSDVYLLQTRRITLFLLKIIIWKIYYDSNFYSTFVLFLLLIFMSIFLYSKMLYYYVFTKITLKKFVNKIVS